ncbi:unnamed protein product [Closterium sp. NIES-64]|nr:unnamed protein product [Closterium sp. NIES-64]
MAALAGLSSSMAAVQTTSSAKSSLFGASLAAKPMTAQPHAAPSVIRMAIKRWERKEVKDNSLPVCHKLHVHVGDTVQVRASGRHRAGACEWATPCRCVRVGDTVQVIAGRDKGKVTEVVRVINHNSSVLCRDINIKTKHVKGKAEGEAGQIIQMEAPIHSSNVMLYSKQQKVTSRVGHKVLEDGSKVRYLLKTGEVLDQPSEWKRTAKKEKKDKPKGDSL